MCRKELKVLHQRLSVFLGEIEAEGLNDKIATLMELVRQTQQHVEAVLEEKKESTSQSLVSLSENSYKTQGANFVRTCYENNNQQLDLAAHCLLTPLSELRKGNSVTQEWTMEKTGFSDFGKGQRMGKNGKFQSIMENLRQIIRYQNKIEKNQLPLQQLSMTDLQEQIKPNLFAQIPSQESPLAQNKRHSPEITNTLNQLFRDCRRLECDLEKFHANRRRQDTENQSENTDKKSLLTEMIKASQIISNMDDFQPIQVDTPLTENKRTHSVNGQKMTTRSEKKPLKEIDFSDYKIESIKGVRRKEKKARQNNCGQCSQCRLF